jgi:hypothetical protein
MTVTVTLTGGGADEYLRFGDSYVEHDNGTLDVVRMGAKKPVTYAAGEWTEVRGDACRSIKRRIWG